MKKDCVTIACKSVKDTDLYLSGRNGGYTVAQAQVAYDQYIAQGYVQFDVSALHSLDVSGEADVNMILVWKTDSPIKGEYRFKASYFAGKNVVIMGVKLDGSDAVTATNLKIYINEIESGSTDYPVVFDGLEVISMKAFSAIDWTTISCKRTLLRVMKNSTISGTAFSQTDIYNYGTMDIESASSTEVATVSNASIGVKGTVVSNATHTTRTAFCACGAYIFAIGADQYVEYYDRETGVYIGREDIGAVPTLICAAGQFVYCFAGNSNVYVCTITSSGISLTTTTFCSVGQTETCCVADFDNVYYGMSSTNNFYKSNGPGFTSGYSTLNLSQHTSDMCMSLTHVYCNLNSTGVVKEVEKSSFTVTKTLTFTKNTADNKPVHTDGVYLYSGTSSNYSDTINTILISSGEETSINVYTPEYMAIVTAGFDGENMIFYQKSGNTCNLWKSLPGAITFTKILTFSLTSFITCQILDLFRLTYLEGANLNGVAYNDPTNECSFIEITSLDASLLTASDFLTITLAKLRMRYYTPPESSIDVTRMYYLTEFDPLANIEKAFKKFCGGRTLVVNRSDISAVLAVAGTPKKIIRKIMYDNDGATAYTYDDLPSDENFFILATDPLGFYHVFAWYNEEILDTYFSNNVDGTVHTIVACFQLWKRRSTEIDLVQMRNDDDSPLEGTIEWNNNDNENIVK
jgi:hypothetical protein